MPQIKVATNPVQAEAVAAQNRRAIMAAIAQPGHFKRQGVTYKKICPSTCHCLPTIQPE
jgi:hypothetical protein